MSSSTVILIVVGVVLLLGIITKRLLKVIGVLFYDVYGIFRRISSGEAFPIVIAIIQILSLNGCGIIWVIDLITVLFCGEVTFIVGKRR